jgi:hypothetical protein
MTRVFGRPGRLEILALIGILVLAALLRLSAPGVVEFKRDEANLSYLALDLVRGQSLPLLGISSSVGIPNSPMSVYLFAVPYVFSSDPTLATQFVGLLNVLAVLLTYLLARRYYGAGVALLAALLYAVSPWAVIYSRKIWAQDLLPPFVLATILTALIGFIEGKRWAQWLCLPLLSITAQIHYSALTLFVPVVYLIWVGRAHLRRAFVGSIMLAGVLALPFLLGILQADLPTVQELQVLAGSGESRSIGITGDTIHYAALTIAGTEIHSLAGAAAYLDYLATVPDVYPLFGLLAWGVLFAVMWLVVRIWHVRDDRRPLDVLLLIWLLTPIIVFSITWTTPYPHYLIPAMPVAYIVFAVGVGDLGHALRYQLAVRRLVFGAGGFVVAAILLLQVFLWVRLVDFLNTTYTPGGFGAPLAYVLPVRTSILESGTPQVLASLDGQFVGTNDDATVWNVLLYDVPSRRFLDADTQVVPADPAVRLTNACDDANALHFLLRSSQEGCYQVVVNDDTPSALSVDSDASLDTVLSNGVRLEGYTWAGDAEPCLSLTWSVSQPTDQDYSFLVHFTNVDGQEILNVDGLSWLGRYWRPGDTVTRQFCLSPDQAALVPEIAGVNLGMYTYDGTNFHNVDVLDVNGVPSGQIVHVPLKS